MYTDAGKVYPHTRSRAAKSYIKKCKGQRARMQTVVPGAYVGYTLHATCSNQLCEACTRHDQRGLLLGLVCHSGVQAPLCIGLLAGTCLFAHGCPPLAYVPGHAAHVSGTAVLAGMDKRFETAKKTAETMQNDIEAFSTPGVQLELQSFHTSCRNAVRIFCQAAQDHWQKMFALSLVSQEPRDPHSQRVLLQMACISIDEDVDVGIGILDDEDSVVAQLAVIVSKGEEGHFCVESKHFSVVDCLRGMQLDLLLEACGLLCAIQFACLAGHGQRVQIKSNFLAQHLPSHRGTVPFSMQTVANSLWKWYEDSAHMYATPLALQIHQQVLGKRKQEAVQAQQVQHIHNNLRDFVKKSKDELKNDNLFLIGCFERALQNAAKVMNEEAGTHWREFFRFTVAAVPVDKSESISPQAACYYLQIICTQSINIEQCANLRSKNAEAVVARLKLRVHKQCPNDFKRAGAFCTFYVEMEAGVTVICLRYMHLGTLLRACALLAAQQFAYFATGEQTVGFKGYAVSEVTKKIYTKLFADIRARTDEETLEHCAILESSHKTVPPSLTNVATLLTHALHSSVLLWHAPLPTQIKRKE